MRFLPLLLLSCASLNAGWVKVDFVEGRVPDMMVCQNKINSAGDIEAKCVSLDAVEREMKAKKQKENEPWSL
jgi:hypothetical protein